MIGTTIFQDKKGQQIDKFTTTHAFTPMSKGEIVQLKRTNFLIDQVVHNPSTKTRTIILQSEYPKRHGSL